MTNFPVKSAGRPDPEGYGRKIPQGLGVNLLTKNVESSARFQVEVLGAQVMYWEDHFAIMYGFGSTWFLHSDWSYRDHEMLGVIADTETRGAGVELRLYGADPDACEARARLADAIVLAGSSDKPHGLREAYIADQDGYTWVPSIPSKAT
jgi:hypothetical protein